jgi:squalene-hopene/tetraprenyl-beta-curcumene cyclase
MAWSAAAVLVCLAATAGEPEKPRYANNSADEAKAKEASIDNAAAFLDEMGRQWTAERKCMTCHTNVPQMIAATWLKREPTAAEKEVRAFMEGRVANWDRGNKGDKPRNDTEVVVTAATLALHDAGTTGKLHERTKAALARMWKAQQKDGAWDWEKCEWPPLEHDDYYGAVFAAVAVGHAPDDYAKGEAAKEGLAKLVKYLGKTPAPNLHHELYLVWASRKLDGLMTDGDVAKAVKRLKALQREDGGWSLASLGDWKGFDGRENDAKAPSDGYATGLAVFVLRQAGAAKDDAAVKQGVAWLKANQRESGRWFTRSLNTDRRHYITHAGTAYALMALKACE